MTENTYINSVQCSLHKKPTNILCKIHFKIISYKHISTYLVNELLRKEISLLLLLLAPHCRKCGLKRASENHYFVIPLSNFVEGCKQKAYKKYILFSGGL